MPAGYDCVHAALGMPIQVFQGRRDDAVDPVRVEQWSGARPNVELHMLEDDHQLTSSVDYIWGGDEAVSGNRRSTSKSPWYCAGISAASIFSRNRSMTTWSGRVLLSASANSGEPLPTTITSDFSSSSSIDVAEQRGEVRDLLVDVLLVGADQPRDRHVAVVDAELSSPCRAAPRRG